MGWENYPFDYNGLVVEQALLVRAPQCQLHPHTVLIAHALCILILITNSNQHL
jgi:hypothetical protein